LTARVIALVLALVPTFEKVAPFGWFIGAALGAIAYFIVARGRPLVEAPVEQQTAVPTQQAVD
jgi:NCS1 family nucleobase:cation symporter-1